MKKKNTEEKYLNVLKAISERQRGFRDFRNILTKFKVSVSMQKVLTEKNLIVKDDNGIWKWSSKMPDSAMAAKVLNAVNRGIRNANKSVNKSETKIETKSETMSQRQNQKQATAEKYLNFLTYISGRKRGFKSFGKIIAKFKICSTVGTVLKKRNVMQREFGVWKWTGKKPDMEMAEQILADINQGIMKCIDRKNKKEFPTLNKKMIPRLKRIMNNAESAAKPKVVMHKYVIKKSDDVLNLAGLRTERSQLQERINAIDNLLITVDILNKK